MSSIKKKKKALTLDLRLPDFDIRGRALGILSELICQKNQQETAFSLSKMWSVKEPPRFPSNQQALASVLENEIHGKAFPVDARSIMDWYCPLLAKYSLPLDSSNVGWLTWVRFRCNIYSLGPTSWRECRRKLTTGTNSDVVDIPVFLDGVSERLYQTYLKDTKLVNFLQDLSRKHVRDKKTLSSEAGIERCRNVEEMNRCLSFMHLFYFLYEKGQWSGLDIVEQFFKEKIGDRDALQRHCAVLDVDALTSREVNLDENKEPRLEYVMVDSELQMRKTEQEEKEENAWWQWVENRIRDLCKQTKFGKEEFDELDKIMYRIDRRGSRTRRAIEALADWQTNVDM